MNLFVDLDSSGHGTNLANLGNSGDLNKNIFKNTLEPLYYNISF